MIWSPTVVRQVTIEVAQTLFGDGGSELVFPAGRVQRCEHAIVSHQERAGVFGDRPDLRHGYVPDIRCVQALTVIGRHGEQ